MVTQAQTGASSGDSARSAQKTRHPVWVCVAFAVAVTLIAKGLCYAVLGYGLGFQPLVLFAAVVVSAWFGGMLPGLVSMLLALPMQILMLPPAGQFRLTVINDKVELVMFVVLSVLVSGLFEYEHRRRRSQ